MSQTAKEVLKSLTFSRFFKVVDSFEVQLKVHSQIHQPTTDDIMSLTKDDGLGKEDKCQECQEEEQHSKIQEATGGEL